MTSTLFSLGAARLAVATILAVGATARGQEPALPDSTSGTKVTVTFGGTAMPTAVATRVGTGEFALARLTDKRLTVNLPAGMTDASVAYQCPELEENPYSATIFEEVANISSQDLTSETIYCPVEVAPLGKTGKLTFSADADGVPGGEEIEIVAQNSKYSASVSTAELEPTSSMQAPTGTDTVDVLVYGNGNDLLAARTFTGQSVPGALNAGETVVLGEADRTRSEFIHYEKVPPGFNAPITNVSFAPAGLAVELELSANATTSYRALPAGAAKPGDAYVLAAYTQSKSVDSVVNVEKYTESGGAQTLTFPEAWSYSRPEPAALPTFQLNYRGFEGKPGVKRSATISWLRNSILQVQYYVSSTQNYAGGADSVTLPDLSHLKGFLPGPAPGASVWWAAYLDQSSAGFGPWTPEVILSGVVHYGEFKVP